MKVDASDARRTVAALVAAGIPRVVIADKLGVALGVVANLSHAQTGQRRIDAALDRAIRQLDLAGLQEARVPLPEVTPVPVGRALVCPTPSCPTCRAPLVEDGLPDWLSDTGAVVRAGARCLACRRRFVVTVTMRPLPQERKR